MADDAGALLVRSGLVPSSALDDARTRVVDHGGTIGEQLVGAGAISDEALTDFYRSRLLVPQVNPNTLARLPVRVVAAIPSDMAIDLRVIPVSLDNENTLTVAMSDPSDSHAVDEIAFFTGAYVVRAVATQMQIAWCLAHYYGHVTPLGQKLLQPTEAPAPAPAPPPPEPPSGPRTKGDTEKVQAMRHRAIAPVSTGPINQARPNSGEIELAEHSITQKVPPAIIAPSVPVSNDAGDKVSRARSVSGEIRVPIRRAPSIKPPMPEPLTDDDDDDDDESGPVITMEVDVDDDPTGPAHKPVRRRVKTDPPELAARAGEVDIATGPVLRVDLDEPRIIINDEPPPGPPNKAVSGELRAVEHREAPIPSMTIEVSEDTGVGVVIHEHYSRESEPVLLQRKLPSTSAKHATPVKQEDTSDVVVLEARKPRQPRSEKRTQVGIGIVPAVTRAVRDTEQAPIPGRVDERPTTAQHQADLDATRVDAYAIAPSPGDITDETVAPPPPPSTRTRLPRPDTSPNVAPPPIGAKRAPSIAPSPAPSRPPSVAARAASNDDDDDGDGDGGTLTSVMSAVELDDAIPERDADILPAHLDRKRAASRVDYDPVDDGWGPPGTTIPPPLLGAIPGSEDDEDDAPSNIPMANLDSAPLIVTPPTPPEPARGSPAVSSAGQSLARALEQATSRAIELIHSLERAQSRDEAIGLMSRHLAETHRRAGFFSIKGGELGLFSMLPKPELIPVTTLRLDRPSTLQDVVGTRLPYRGPMHDDASRNFLAAALGACPPEILLVPVAVRERVVGVLFGEHRMRHTFDDQLALAARAAGMALERILKSKRP
jgi:hypothetical protein